MYRSGLDVVVVNYRTPHLLKDFVDSYVFQSSDIDTELVIIDVDPTEDTYEQTREFLSKYDFRFQYWPIDYNCGYSGACNFASIATDHEVIAFFNSDTRLFDDTLEVCYKYLMEHPDTAACGPLQVDSGGYVTSAGIIGSNTRPKHRGWRSRNSAIFNQNEPDVISVSGSAYFVNRAIWDELASDAQFRELYPNSDGAFLPTKHYYEETWFSYFARHKGYKIAFVGETMMIHEWHKSSPVGSVEGKIMRESQGMFRDACDHIGIPHD